MSGNPEWDIGNLTVASGATFTPPDLVRRIANGNVTWNVDGTEVFNDITMNVTTANKDITISSGDTIQVDGTLTLNQGSINTGTVDARGNINQASTFNGGTATLDFGDNGVAQTYTIPGGTTPIIRLDNASDANDLISFTGAAIMTNLNVTSGFSGTVPI